MCVRSINTFQFNFKHRDKNDCTNKFVTFGFIDVHFWCAFDMKSFGRHVKNSSEIFHKAQHNLLWWKRERTEYRLPKHQKDHLTKFDKTPTPFVTVGLLSHSVFCQSMFSPSMDENCHYYYHIRLSNTCKWYSGGLSLFSYSISSIFVQLIIHIFFFSFVI